MTKAKKIEQQIETTSGHDLMVVEIKNPSEVFVAGGLESILVQIEEAARSVHLDVSTAKGQEDIRSIAFKIARSKTTIEKVGKALTELGVSEKHCKAIVSAIAQGLIPHVSIAY